MRLQGKTALVTGGLLRDWRGDCSSICPRGGTGGPLRGVMSNVDTRSLRRYVRLAVRLFFVLADLTSRKEIDRLVDETHKAVGQIDILVNNAGIFPMTPTAQVDEATFDRGHRDECQGPFFPEAAFAPGMVERGSGKIINITTVLAHKGFPSGSLYGATKAALTLLTKSWAAEFGPGGVNVNAIAPHLVRTPGIEEHIEIIERIASALPAQRYAMPLRLQMPLSILPATKQTLCME